MESSGGIVVDPEEFPLGGSNDVIYSRDWPLSRQPMNELVSEIIRFALRESLSERQNKNVA